MPGEMFDYLDEKVSWYFLRSHSGFGSVSRRKNPIPRNGTRITDNYYNHASIIGWCVGNEIGESPGVMELWKMLSDL